MFYALVYLQSAVFKGVSLIIQNAIQEVNTMKNAISGTLFFGTLMLSQFSAAGVSMGVDMGGPMEIGGIAAAAALSLIIATQLTKRRK